MLVDFNQKGWGLVVQYGGSYIMGGGAHTSWGAPTLWGGAYTLWGVSMLIFLRQNTSMMEMAWWRGGYIRRIDSYLYWGYYVIYGSYVRGFDWFNTITT